MLTPDLTREAWADGDLSWKLRPYQVESYDAMWNAITSGTDVFVNVQARRTGKTFVTRIVATEFALRIPECNVNIAGPVGREMRKINQTVMRQILRDCPPELQPTYNKADGTYTFPNGSHIFTAGLNGDHADDQRGNDGNLNLIDEAGFVDELEYALLDIYAPQTDTSGGTNILISTPPKTPAHDFVDIKNVAERDGNYIMRTIHQTDYTDAKKDQIATRCGGVLSTTWRREYLCEFVVDSDLQIVPEWNEKYVQDVDRGEFFAFWHKYDAMDLGVRDLNATLFGYYDFKNARLVIEDEWIASGPQLTTDVIANKVAEVEARLDYRDMYRRVADNNNPLLLNDLRALHGMQFVPTSKDELPAMINELRLWIGTGRVAVHPRCANLIGCLKNAIWKDSRDGRFIGRELARTKAYGHFDALMALVYLVRNVDVHTNPIPRLHGFDPQTQFLSRHGQLIENEELADIVKLFGPKRRVA